MSAGVVMQRLQAAGVRNIILTSGTLTPLSATAEELAVPMPIRLENPHVVKPEQVCSGPPTPAYAATNACAATTSRMGPAQSQLSMSWPRPQYILLSWPWKCPPTTAYAATAAI